MVVIYLECRRSAYIHAVPDVVPQRLFTTRPPHGHDDEHGRRDGGLEGAHDEPERRDTRETSHSGHDGNGSAPAEKAEAYPDIDRNLDQSVDGD